MLTTHEANGDDGVGRDVAERREMAGGAAAARAGARLKRPLIRGDLNVIYKSVPGG
jgi:hypothetical protein